MAGLINKTFWAWIWSSLFPFFHVVGFTCEETDLDKLLPVAIPFYTANPIYGITLVSKLSCSFFFFKKLKKKKHV